MLLLAVVAVLSSAPEQPPLQVDVQLDAGRAGPELVRHVAAGILFGGQRVSLCLSASLHLCLSASLCVSVSLRLCLSVSLSLSHSQAVSLSPCLSLCARAV